MRVRPWMIVAATVLLSACGGGHGSSTVSVTSTSADTGSTTTTGLAALPTMPPQDTAVTAAPSTTTRTSLASVTATTVTSTTSTTAASSLVAQGGTADLHITLTITPAAPHRGQTVQYVIDATDTQSKGALNRSIDYGDGQQAPPTAAPQFCTGQAQTQQQRWTFQHAYSGDGTFTVVARVTRVCGQGSATAQLNLVVKG